MDMDQHGSKSSERQSRRAACSTKSVPPASCGPRRILFSRPYTLHCKVLSTFWVGLVLLQFLFPGFEARGLFSGLIPGCWVLALVRVPMDLIYAHILIALICITVLSGYLVFLCGWLMDKARLGKQSWILFALLLLTGALFFSTKGSSYREWRMSPIIQQAVHAPEVNYEPNRRDYNRTILIPRTIAGGLWGFYASSMFFGLLALSKILRKTLRSNTQNRGAASTPSTPGMEPDPPNV